MSELPGGELPYKSDGDARRFSLGCRLQIFVSLKVFGMESYYICPFRYRLELFMEKVAKNALTLTTQKSPLGVSLSLSHTHIGLPWWFNVSFPTSIPVTFIWEYPAPLHPRADVVTHRGLKIIVSYKTISPKLGWGGLRDIPSIMPGLVKFWLVWVGGGKWSIFLKIDVRKILSYLYFPFH